MARIKSTTLLLAALVLCLTGCASSLSSQSYSRNEALQPMAVQYGVVQSVQAARIEGTKSGAGALAGAVAGGAAGSAVGGGRGSVVATVAGAVIGGLAGAAGEEGLTRKDAQQITVRLDDGRLVAIVQAGKTPFKGGERVQVLTSPDGNMRVEPAASQAPPAPRPQGR